MFDELETLTRKTRLFAKYGRREIPPEGLSSTQVDELMAAQGVTHLPEDYRTFLKAFGKQAGAYAEDLKVFPHGPQYKDWLQEGLADEGVVWPLEGAFVLGHHGGYTFWWLHDAAGERPFVLYWTEGWPEPRPLARDFAGFLAIVDRDGDRLMRDDLEQILGRSIRVSPPGAVDAELDHQWAAARTTPISSASPAPVTIYWEPPHRWLTPPTGPVPEIPDVHEWMADVEQRRDEEAVSHPPEMTPHDVEEANQLWPLP